MTLNDLHTSNVHSCWNFHFLTFMSWSDQNDFFSTLKLWAILEFMNSIAYYEFKIWQESEISLQIMICSLWWWKIATAHLSMSEVVISLMKLKFHKRWSGAKNVCSWSSKAHFHNLGLISCLVSKIAICHLAAKILIWEVDLASKRHLWSNLQFFT